MKIISISITAPTVRLYWVEHFVEAGEDDDTGDDTAVSLVLAIRSTMQQTDDGEIYAVEEPVIWLDDSEGMVGVYEHCQISIHNTLVACPWPYDEEKDNQAIEKEKQRLRRLAANERRRASKKTPKGP
jgi:hypothetical protein